MWEHCVSTIERDPMDLDREVDWVIKHKLIEGYRAKHDLPLTDPKIALLDLQYHDISRQRGVFYKLQRSEEHPSELQSLMRISYAVFCLKKTKRSYQLLYAQKTTHHNKHSNA